MYPPETDGSSESWAFEPLDPLLNAREKTVTWIRMHCPGKEVDSSSS
jgi:geranylgeranyl transferase type-1 subunit beta